MLFQTVSDLDGLLPTSADGFGALAAFLGVLFLAIGITTLLFYIYFSLTLQKTAQRLSYEKAWLAWIPFANIYLLFTMADFPKWYVAFIIALAIPFLNFIAFAVVYVLSIIATWRICEARQRPGWWAVLTVIPILGWMWLVVLWGILAFGE